MLRTGDLTPLLSSPAVRASGGRADARMRTSACGCQSSYVLADQEEALLSAAWARAGPSVFPPPLLLLCAQPLNVLLHALACTRAQKAALPHLAGLVDLLTGQLRNKLREALRRLEPDPPAGSDLEEQAGESTKAGRALQRVLFARALSLLRTDPALDGARCVHACARGASGANSRVSSIVVPPSTDGLYQCSPPCCSTPRPFLPYV